MAGSHHAPSPGLVTKTRAAVVLTVLVVALAIIGLYSATHRSSTSAAKGAAKSISVTKASGSSRSPASAGPSSTPAGATATAPPTTAPPTTAPPTTTPSATATGNTAAALAPLTYVVQPGDNLTIIAAWFHIHGYGQLYDANKAVIGADPDLIHPGQHITISSGGMTTSH